jgi:hypothetical protein
LKRLEGGGLWLVARENEQWADVKEVKEEMTKDKRAQKPFKSSLD